MRSSELNVDVTRVIFELLAPQDWLRCAMVSTELRVRCNEQLAAPEMHLEGAEVNDQFLRWLLTRIPRNTLKTLVLTDCTELSRAGVMRALRFGHTKTLDEMRALKVGGASWSVDELHWLVDACPSLRVLHVDCRAKGTSADQLGLLANEQLAFRPTRIVLQRPKTAVAGDNAHEDAAAALDVPAVHGPDQPAAAAVPAAAAGPPAAVADDAAVAAAEAEPAAEYLSPLGAALQRCKGSLQELDARGDVLDRSGVDHVNSLLSSSGCALRRLRLPGALAINAKIDAFAEALAGSALEELQLGCSFMNASVATTLASALPANRALRRLELQHCPLLDAGAAALADALSSNRALRALSVPFTGLGDSACAALARALRGGSALTSLDLAGNRLSADGVAELAGALGEARGLATLSLAANQQLGARGASAIAAALPRSALATLQLDGCAIGPAPCGRLAAALAASSVTSLDLSSNEIGDQGAWELAWRLPECARLRTLRLAVNEIEEDGAAELLSGLHANLKAAAPAGIALLDLRGNRVPPACATAEALGKLGRANLAFQRPPMAPPSY